MLPLIIEGVCQEEVEEVEAVLTDSSFGRKLSSTLPTPPASTVALQRAWIAPTLSCRRQFHARPSSGPTSRAGCWTVSSLHLTGPRWPRESLPPPPPAAAPSCPSSSSSLPSSLPPQEPALNTAYTYTQSLHKATNASSCF